MTRSGSRRMTNNLSDLNKNTSKDSHPTLSPIKKSIVDNTDVLRTSSCKQTTQPRCIDFICKLNKKSTKNENTE